MTRKQQIYQRLLNVSIILIIVNLILFFIDIIVLVFNGAIDCSGEAVLCEVDQGFAFFEVVLWVFGITAFASMIAARIFHYQMQRGEKLVDASSYRKSLQKQQSVNFSESTVYDTIRSGKKIKERKQSDNQIIVNMQKNLSKLGENIANGWNKFVELVKELPEKTKEKYNTFKTNREETKQQKAEEKEQKRLEDEKRKEELAQQQLEEEKKDLELNQAKELEDSVPKAPDSEKQEVNIAHEVTDPAPTLNDVKETVKPEPKDEKEVVEEVKEEPKPEPKEEKQVVEEVKDEPKPKPKKKKKRKNITKTSLIEIINSETELSKNKSGEFLDTLLQVIQDELVSRNDVEVTGIGHFTTIEMPAKDAVNPQTQEKIVVPAHHQVRFRFTEDFEEEVNQSLMDDEEDEDAEDIQESIQKAPDSDKQKVNEANEVTDPTPSLKEEQKSEPKEEVKESKDKPKPVVEEKTEEAKPEPKKKPKKKKKRKSITKTKLINIINKETDLSKNKSGEFLDTFLQVIQEELVSRNDVEVTGIGHFTTIEMPAKDAVNPQTQEKIVVPAHHQVRFRFDDEFKELVESQEDEE